MRPDDTSTAAFAQLHECVVRQHSLHQELLSTKLEFCWSSASPKPCLKAADETGRSRKQGWWVEGKEAQDVIHTTVLNIWKSWEGKEQHSGSAQPVPEEQQGRCQQTLQGVLPVQGLGCAGRAEIILGHWPHLGWEAPAKQILNCSLEGWGSVEFLPVQNLLIEREKKKKVIQYLLRAFPLIQCGVHKEGLQEPSYLNGLIYTGNNLRPPGSGNWSSGLWNSNNWEGRYPWTWVGNRLRTGNSHFSVTFSLICTARSHRFLSDLLSAPYIQD